MLKMIKITENKYNNFRENVIKLKALRDEKEIELNTQKIHQKSINNEIIELTKVRNLLETCNITSRKFVKQEVEQLVTQSLRTIFDVPHVKFNIDFVEKRNQTEALFYLSEEGEEEHIESEIIFTYGGGVVDIIAISLRIIIMQLLNLQGPLILDEPGKNISSQYVSRFGKFLTDVSKAFDRQIIMITHNTTLANCADNTIKVVQQNGISEIE